MNKLIVFSTRFKSSQSPKDFIEVIMLLPPPNLDRGTVMWKTISGENLKGIK